jgi:Flp pilus assembly protein CpaB
MSAPPSGFLARNPVALAVAFVLAGAAVACAVEVFAPGTLRGGKTVEVVVAARDLQLGTPFTRDNIDMFTTTARVPKADVPKDAVRSKKELLDKRLYRPARRGEPLAAADVKPAAHVALAPGMEVVTVPVSDGLQNSFAGPGCRVDLIAIHLDGSRREVFTLLPDVHVLDAAPTTAGKTAFSFAVDAKHAALVSHAGKANCTLEVMLRHPDSPKRYFEYDATLARVRDLVRTDPKPHPTELAVAPVPHTKPAPVPVAEVALAPAPRAKRLVTVGLSGERSISGFIAPGSRVDVVATAGTGSKREAFTLLANQLVVSVDAELDATGGRPVVEVNAVTFSLGEREARLLALADDRGCHLELVLRTLDAPQREYDAARVLSILQTLPRTPRELAPPPRAKGR